MEPYTDIYQSHFLSRVKEQTKMEQAIYKFKCQNPEMSATVVYIHVNPKNLDRIQQLTYSTVELIICTQAIIYIYLWFTRS